MPWLPAYQISFDSIRFTQCYSSNNAKMMISEYLLRYSVSNSACSDQSKNQEKYELNTRSSLTT